MCTHTLAEHEALKADWYALEPLGYQETETDTGAEAWLELRNVPSCKSTLARDCLPSEFPTARAWWSGYERGRSAAAYEAVI
jgi:hypothetical protein